MFGNEFTGELVGLAAGSAVADGDQFDLVFGAELLQSREGAVPLPLGFVRIDGVGGDDFAGGIDDGDLHTGAQPGIEPQHAARPGRCGQQQILEVVAEYRNCLVFGLFARGGNQFERQIHHQPRAPRKTAGVAQPLVGGTALHGNARSQRNAAFGIGVAMLDIGRGFEIHRQHVFAASTQQREHAVRGNIGERFGVIKIVAELGAFVFLASDNLRAQHALGLQPVAQLADQRRILAEAFDQDCACAVQRGGGIGHALVRIDEGFCAFVGCDGRIGEDRIGQRFQPCLARDLRLGAALGFVRQIQIFEPRLAVRGEQVIDERLCQFPLLGDRRQDRIAAIFHLAQIDQPGV